MKALKAPRWAETCRRYEAIRRLIEVTSSGGQNLRWRTRPGVLDVGWATVYQLVDIYELAGTIEALQPKAMGRRAGTRIPARKAEEIIERAIRFALGVNDAAKKMLSKRPMPRQANIQSAVRSKWSRSITPRSASLKLTANLRFQRVTVTSQIAQLLNCSRSANFQQSHANTPGRPVTFGSPDEVLSEFISSFRELSMRRSSISSPSVTPSEGQLIPHSPDELQMSGQHALGLAPESGVRASVMIVSSRVLLVEFLNSSCPLPETVQP